MILNFGRAHPLLYTPSKRVWGVHFDKDRNLAGGRPQGSGSIYSYDGYLGSGVIILIKSFHARHD